MPSRKPPMEERTEWTLAIPAGPECSVGCSDNEVINWDGSRSPGRPNEDRFYTCYYQNSVQLYMVLDGHDGVKAVDFAKPHIPHVLLHQDLSGGDKGVLDALRLAIVNTEQEFFLRIDGHITRKLTLQMEIEQKVPDADSSMAYRLFPTQIAEIGRLDDLIKGGTTVVTALIYQNKLYVANVGDSRALLCAQNPDGSVLRVEQLSVDHNTSNEEELRRLAKCGLDPVKIRQVKRLGMQQNTRSIGDHAIKGGYPNVDVLKDATSQPGIADPYLHRPVDLTNFHGFLVLMSDGLYEAYEAWTARPDRVNEDLSHLVAQEIAKSPDLKGVAQNVVEKVKHLYRSTCAQDRRSGRLDDITLIVKILVPHFLRTHSDSYLHQQQQQQQQQAHHQLQRVPPSTAPVTDKRFDFGRPQMQQQYGYGQPSEEFRAYPPNPQPPPPTGGPGDYGAQYRPPPRGYYPQNQPYGSDYNHSLHPREMVGVDPVRGGGVAYHRAESSIPTSQMQPSSMYHHSVSTPHGRGGGGGYPQAPPPGHYGNADRGGGYHHQQQQQPSREQFQPYGYYGQPGANQQPHPSPPHHSHSYSNPSHPTPSHPSPPDNARQGSDHHPINWDDPSPRKYENVPQQNTGAQQQQQQTNKPPAPDLPKQEETPPPPLPPRPQAQVETPPRPQAQVETPPPNKSLGPESMPGDNEEDELMYGWTPESKKDTLGAKTSETTTPIKQPVMEPEVRKEESQTLQQEPEHDSKHSESHDLVDSSNSSEMADVVYYDEDEPESTEEDPPVESTDGSGTIQPYITFTTHFPVELSWGDIAIPT